MGLIVAATGHRPDKLGGYSKDIESKLYDLAVEELGKINPTKVISGMALGWDQAVAKACNTLSIPWIAAVPFIGQEKAWPKESQTFYHELLDTASEYIIVREGTYHPSKMYERNIWMVDRSDLVLALWDGSSGGTGHCVKYANKVKKPIKNLWSLYNEEGLSGYC